MLSHGSALPPFRGSDTVVPSVVSTVVASRAAVVGPGDSLTLTFVLSKVGSPVPLTLFEAPNSVQVLGFLFALVNVLCV